MSAHNGFVGVKGVRNILAIIYLLKYFYSIPVSSPVRIKKQPQTGLCFDLRWIRGVNRLINHALEGRVKIFVSSVTMRKRKLNRGLRKRARSPSISSLY